MPGRSGSDRDLGAAARLVQLVLAWLEVYFCGALLYSYWSTTIKLAFRCLKDLIAFKILSNRLSLKFF